MSTNPFLRFLNYPNELVANNVGIIRFVGDKLESKVSESEGWKTLNQVIASETQVGSIKKGNNVFIDSDGKLNSIAVGPSRFYQHIVTVSKYTAPDNTYGSTLPDGTVINGGSGDFTTIQAAINFIVNRNTIDSINYPLDSDNRWTISISPGVYEEDIVLKQFISLVGSGKDVTILKPTGNQTNYITMEQDTTIQNLSIEYDFPNTTTITNNIVFITKNNSGDSTLSNIKINIIDYRNQTTSSKVIYLNEGNLNIEDTDITITPITSEGETIYGIDIDSSTECFMNRCTIIANTNKTMRFIDNKGDLTIRNSKILVDSGVTDHSVTTTNHVIYNKNGNLNIFSSIVENTVKNSYSIYNLADSSSLVRIDQNNILATDFKLLSNVVQFKTKTEDKETNEELLKKCNAVKINNKNYKVLNVRYNSSTEFFFLDLDTNRNYSDVSSISLQDIFILNTVSIDSSSIIADNTIYNNNDYTLLELNNIGTSRGNLDISGSALLEYNNFNIVHVSMDKGDFNSLSSAIIALNDSSQKKYLIHVHNGVYYESSKITLTDSINIIGDGPENTRIIFKEISGIDLSGNEILSGANNIISNLSFEYTKTDLSNNIAILEYTDKQVTLENVKFVLNGNNLTAIKIINSGVAMVNKLDNIDININYNFSDGDNKDLVGIDISSNTKETKIKNLRLKVENSSSFSNLGNFTNCKIYGIKLSGVHLLGTNFDIDYSINTASNHIVSECINISGSPTKISNVIGSRLIIENSEDAAYVKTLANNQSDKGLLFINCNLNGIVTETTNGHIYTPNCVTFISNEAFSYKNNFLTSENSNVLIGKDTSHLASKNILIGDDTGKSIISGGNSNILIGDNASNSLQTGDYNISIGELSGDTLTTGENNINIGFESGKNNNASNSVNVGYKAGYTNTGTGSNIFLGSNSGYNNTGSGNIHLGRISNVSGLTGKASDNSIVIGNDSGINCSGDTNIFIGNESGKNTTGDINMFIGHNSGLANISGENNTFIGYDTGKTMTDKSNNTIIGYSAGSSSTGCENSIMVGYNSGVSNTGNNNIFVGNECGNNSTGGENVFIGNNSGNANTIGTKNTFIGFDTGKTMTDKEKNTVLGHSAAASSTGSECISVGVNSGLGNTSTGSIFVGNESGKVNTGNNNSFIGNNSGLVNQGGASNVFIGNESGKANTTGNNNCIIGYNSGITMDVKSFNTIIGSNAGNEATGNNSVLIGYNSGYSNTGNDSIAIGYEAGKVATGTSNIFIGKNSGIKKTSGNNNTLCGTETGSEITDGADNTYIGYGAGKYNNGTGNVIMGNNAGGLDTLTNTSNNTLIGNEAGQYFNGDSSVIIGSGAGKRTATTDTINVDNNLLIGKDSGKVNNKYNNLLVIGNNSGGAVTELITATNIYEDSQNLIVGNNSGNVIDVKVDSNKSCGRGNTILGNNSGNSMTTGQNNLLVGDGVGRSLVDGKNNNFIGSNSDIVFRKKAGLAFDINYIYGTGTSPNITYASDQNKMIIDQTPETLVGNTLGVKSRETFKAGVFLGETLKGGVQGPLIVDLDGNTVTNQLLNTSYINNYGGKNFGMYYDSLDGSTLIFEDETAEPTSQEQYDSISGNNSNLKVNNEFKPGDIIEITRKSSISDSSYTKIHIARVYAVIMVIDKKSSGIVLSNFTTADIRTNYQYVEERLYFTPIDGTSVSDVTFAVENDIIIRTLNSSGSNNKSGINNVFLGNETGVLSRSDNNTLIGYSAGKNVSVGEGNTCLGSHAGVEISSGNKNICIGDESGRNISSDKNIIIGSETCKNNKNGSTNTIIGNSTGKLLDGNGNIMVGNNSGIKMTSGKGNIMLGNNSFMEKTSGNNNIFIGNGSANDIVGYTDNNANGMMVINNKETTYIVENVFGNPSYTDSVELCFLPVENSHIFEKDDILKIYNSNIYNRNDSTYTDYYDFKLIHLGTHTSSSHYVKPIKSISHTFVGNIKVEYDSSAKYIFKDYSNELRYINFDTNNKISGVRETQPSPVYTLPIIYIATTKNVKGIYQVWSKVQIGDAGLETEYDYIELKKLTNDGNTFSDQSLETLTLNDSKGINFTLSNSILQLYLPIVSTGSYRGRKNTEGNNIYTGKLTDSSTSMLAGNIIEKFSYNMIVNGSHNVRDPEDSTNTNPYKYKLRISGKFVFNIGDKVSIHGNKTYTNNKQTDFFVYKLESINDTDKFIYLCNDNVILSGILTKIQNTSATDTDKYILIKNIGNKDVSSFSEEYKKTAILKQDTSMFFDLNSNKMVVNGNPSFYEKRDSNILPLTGETEINNTNISTNIGHFIVDGTISLSQFLHMKKVENENLVNSIDIPEGEGLLYVLHNGSSSPPSIKFRYNNGNNPISVYTISMS